MHDVRIRNWKDTVQQPCRFQVQSSMKVYSDCNRCLRPNDPFPLDIFLSPLPRPFWLWSPCTTLISRCKTHQHAEHFCFDTHVWTCKTLVSTHKTVPTQLPSEEIQTTSPNSTPAWFLHLATFCLLSQHTLPLFTATCCKHSSTNKTNTPQAYITVCVCVCARARIYMCACVCEHWETIP